MRKCVITAVLLGAIIPAAAWAEEPANQAVITNELTDNFILLDDGVEVWRGNFTDESWHPLATPALRDALAGRDVDIFGHDYPPSVTITVSDPVFTVRIEGVKLTLDRLVEVLTLLGLDAPDLDQAYDGFITAALFDFLEAHSTQILSALSDEEKEDANDTDGVTGGVEIEVEINTGVVRVKGTVWKEDRTGDLNALVDEVGEAATKLIDEMLDYALQTARQAHREARNFLGDLFYKWWFQR